MPCVCVCGRRGVAVGVPEGSRTFKRTSGFGIDDRGGCNHGVLRRLETFHDVNAARPRRVKDKSFSTPEKPNRDLYASILGRGQCSLESRWPSES